MDANTTRAPRVGHKKSRKGCAQCKRRHVKCNEESPCLNCVRHGVPCSLAGGPNVSRDDAKARRPSTTSSSGASRTPSQESHQSSVTVSASASAEPPMQPSPFSVLTCLIDRPSIATLDDAQWMLDLELMHHYLTHTRDIVTEHNDLDHIRVWQEEMPKIAFTSNYCMHGLLGFAALHKAYLQPIEAPMLRTCAVDHLDKALVLYRKEASLTTAENANARFAFTWLVALFAYAIPPSVPPIDAMVELFQLVKGIDTILSESWFWVSQGPFAPILNQGMGSAIATTATTTSLYPRHPLPEGIDFGLNHLDYILSLEPMLPSDRHALALTVAELKTIYTTTTTTSTSACTVASVLSFPKQDSTASCPHFSAMIKRRVPQALVILAYYCVLLDVLDERWWIRGWAARVLQDVLGSLPEQWQSWVEWPTQAVLFKERPPPPGSEGIMLG